MYVTLGLRASFSIAVTCTYADSPPHTNYSNNGTTIRKVIRESMLYKEQVYNGTF